MSLVLATLVRVEVSTREVTFHVLRAIFAPPAHCQFKYCIGSKYMRMQMVNYGNFFD